MDWLALGPLFFAHHPTVGLLIVLALFVAVPIWALWFGVRYRRTEMQSDSARGTPVPEATPPLPSLMK